MYRHDNYGLNTEGKPRMEDFGVLHTRIVGKENEEKAIIQDWILISLILDRFLLLVFGFLELGTLGYLASCYWPFHNEGHDH